MEILTGSDKHVAIEVLAKIYEVANKNTGHVFAFHAMNSLVLIPYLIGVSQYNPYGPEYVFEDVDVPNMHDNDMIINTSQAGFDCIYNQLSTDFYGRIMYILDDVNPNHSWIVISPRNMGIPEYASMKKQKLIAYLHDKGAFFLSITVDTILNNYEKLRNSIRPGTGMHLCNAVYALIAGGEPDIWAGISANLRLHNSMKRKSPHSILDVAIGLQEYYCEYSSITLYIQMARFILEMMCMHLARPERYYGVLMSDKEMRILDTFIDADIVEMFWEPYTCEPSIECYNIVPDDLTNNYMRSIAVTCRDELLLCYAYLNENMYDLEGESYENY